MYRSTAVATHRAFDKLGDAFSGRVSTVRGSEGVVDVVVAQRRQLLAEFLVVALPRHGQRWGENHSFICILRLSCPIEFGYIIEYLVLLSADMIGSVVCCVMYRITRQAKSLGYGLDR